MNFLIFVREKREGKKLKMQNYNLHIPRAAVHNTTNRSCVEEGHWCFEDP